MVLESAILDKIEMTETKAVAASAETWAGLKFVLVTIVLLLGLDTISSIYGLGWPAITVTLALLITLFVFRIVRHRDRAMLAWLQFGVVAGFAELVADWWLVGTGTLIYPQDEPMIWASPAYMPAAWAVVLVQVGYVAGWLRTKLTPIKAALATAAFAGVNIPVYEHLAKGAHWWYYVDTPMLFSAPYYVIVAEFLLALPLAFWARRLVRGGLGTRVLLGLAEGVVMFVAVVIAYRLVGPCVGALLSLPCR